MMKTCGAFKEIMNSSRLLKETL